MRLKQTVYYFSYSDNISDDIFSFSNESIETEKTPNIYLSFTNKIDPSTSITLDKTFIEINNIDSNEIKGYSIIEKLIEEGCKIFDENNKEIIISQKQTPFFQMNDEHIDEEEYLESVNQIKKLSPKEEDSSAVTGEKNDTTPEADKPPVEGVVLFSHGDKYNTAKEKLLKLRFQELEIGDGYGFFYKPEDFLNGKLIKDEGDSIIVLKTEKTENPETVKFDNLKIEKNGDFVNFEKVA